MSDTAVFLMMENEPLAGGALGPRKGVTPWHLTEIFIRYLEYGDEDYAPVLNDWLSRLPERLGKRVIECDEACFGWGMHIIEGPNRKVMFWIMFTIPTSVLTSVLRFDFAE
ncbi:hypothetical protein DL767_002277 [Monosporascus sp. MG133]|nr:hypothetical protein DL767_002277 [Monosporascus sp. MG133]